MHEQHDTVSPWVADSLLFSQRDKKQKRPHCPFCMVLDVLDSAAATSICYETAPRWTVRPFYISLLLSHVKSVLIGDNNIPGNVSQLKVMVAPCKQKIKIKIDEKLKLKKLLN